MLQCEVVAAFGSTQPLLQYGNTDGTGGTLHDDIGAIAEGTWLVL